MNPKKIGEFIAALRKSKGLTQQEVAERLNITNKTVSKWERGDGYPEISLVPAIAELFDVTTDEIFRGARSIKDDNPEKNAAQVQKQKGRFINSSITRFKNYSYIALSVVVIGFVLLFAVAYSFYRPAIAVAINTIFAAVAVSLELIVINNTLGSIQATDLFQETDQQIGRVYRTMYHYALPVFAGTITTVILSVPFIIVRHEHIITRVIQFGDYLKFVPICMLGSIIICRILLWVLKPMLRRYNVYQELNAEQTSALRGVNKTYVIIFIVVFMITIAGHAYILMALGFPVGRKFENNKEFEQYISEYQQYEVDKQLAIEQGAILVNVDHHRDFELKQGIIEQRMLDEASDRTYFPLDNSFERVESWDTDSLTVYLRQEDYNQVRAFRIAVSKSFAYIYLLELIIIGTLLIRKRSMVMKSHK